MTNYGETWRCFAGDAVRPRPIRESTDMLSSCAFDVYRVSIQPNGVSVRWKNRLVTSSLEIIIPIASDVRGQCVLQQRLQHCLRIAEGRPRLLYIHVTRKH